MYSASITAKYVFNVIIVLTGTQAPHRESGVTTKKNRYPCRRDKKRLRPF